MAKLKPGELVDVASLAGHQEANGDSRRQITLGHRPLFWASFVDVLNLIDLEGRKLQREHPTVCSPDCVT
jgi:hypothetical protein